MIEKVPLYELENRMSRFKAKMDSANPSWEMAIIVSKINQYYFTGTMQEGVLLIPCDEKPTYWVRRSFERAIEESLFPNIVQMDSFRDITIDKVPETVYMETEFVPIGYFTRLKRYLPFNEVKPLDAQISAIRAVKSEYELDNMRKSGEIHRKVLEDDIPNILQEGMSEADLGAFFGG